MSSIPTSTSVVESAVIKAPLSHVWHHIKLQNFSDFWSALKSSEFAKGASNEADVVHWTFNDGTELEVKQEEHSTINHYITYSIITAKPDLTYTSALSTIRCYAVTSGELEGSTYIEWSGHFSSDADAGTSSPPPCTMFLPSSGASNPGKHPFSDQTAGVIEDARFKRRDALADLAKVATKK